MTHKITVIECKRIPRKFLPSKPGMARRCIIVEIDGISMEGQVTYEGSYNPSKLNPHNIYRMKLDNKLVTKHPDYKEIRLEILRQMRKLDHDMAGLVIERQHETR